MAKKEPQKKVDFNVQGLWKQSPDAWVNLLTKLGARRPSTSGHETVKLCCPYHADGTPSAVIKRTGFKCFSGSCQRIERDPFALVAKVAGIPYNDAVTVYKEHFGERSLRNPVIAQIHAEELARRRWWLLVNAVSNYLRSFWASEDLTEDQRRVVTWLRDVRGVTDVHLRNDIGAWPTLAELETQLRALNADRADIDYIRSAVGAYLVTNYTNNVVYCYGYGPRDVSALKLRTPYMGNETARVIRPKDDTEHGMGFFGALWSAYEPLYASGSITTAYIVEGEHDQLSMAQGQAASGLITNAFFCVGGSGHSGLDDLAQLGFSRAAIIGDNDEGGKRFPEGLLAKTKDLNCRIFEWPTKLTSLAPGKIDPDALLKMVPYEEAYGELVKESNYIFPPQYCLLQAQDQLANTRKDDAVEIHKVIVNIGESLGNRTDMLAYAKLASEAYPCLTAPEITRELEAQHDSELALLDRLADGILRYYHPIYYEPNTNVIRLWDRHKKAERDITIDSQGCHRLITMLPEGNIYKWVKSEVGLPDFYPEVDGPDSKPGTLLSITAGLENLMQQALRIIGRRAGTKPRELLGQGVHLAKILDGDTPCYLVNGDTVYALYWDPSGRQLSKVLALEGPAHEGAVFTTTYGSAFNFEASEGWMPSLRTAEDFFRLPKYTFDETYQIVRAVINEVMGFRNQIADTLFCAYYPFYTYIHDCMKVKVQSHYYGPFESGKTTLLSMLAGHPQMREFALTYHAVTMDNYTLPSVWQAFTGSRLVIGLDEMNDHDDNSKQSQRTREIYARLRGLCTAGRADYNIGTADHTGKSMCLRAPVITASGTAIHDPMDASRFHVLETKKDQHRANAQYLLHEKYGAQFFEDLRHAIFYHAIHNAPHIARTYAEMPTLFAMGSLGKKLSKINRSSNALLPLESIAVAFGHQGGDILGERHDARKEDAEAQQFNTNGEMLFETLLSSPNVEISAEAVPRKRSLRNCLIQPDWRAAINSSECGVYFDDQTCSILVTWAQARAVLLDRSSYRTTNPAALVSMAKECSAHIDKTRAGSEGILRRLAPYGVASNPHFSVFSVRRILDDVVLSRKEMIEHGE